MLFKMRSTYMQLAETFDRPRVAVLGLLAILGAALVCRIYPIGRGLGQDELFTAVNFVEAPSILRTIFANDAFNNHIGYSLMARFSETLLGRSELALRLPALLFGLASLALFFVLARSILGDGAALVGAGLLALDPAHINWSTQARGYSTMMFATLLSSYCYLRLLRQPTRRDAVLFVGSSVFGIYTHLYAAFVTLVQGLFLAWMLARGWGGAEESARPGSIGGSSDGGRKTEDESAAVARRWSPVQRLVWLWPSGIRSSLRPLAISFAAIFALALLLYVPVLRTMLGDLVGRGRSSFDVAFPLEVFQELSGADSWPVAAMLALAAALGAFVLLRSHRREASYFLALLAVPLAIMWLARPFDLYPRFFAYWQPYYFLLVAAGLRALGPASDRGNPRPIGYSSGLFAGIIIAALLFDWSGSWPSYIVDEGYRDASYALMRGARDPVTYCAIGGARSVWQFYIDRPVVHPQTVAELQNLGRERGEVRCAYYEASWQGADQTELARFLLEHSSWSRVKAFTLFVYRG